VPGRPKVATDYHLGVNDRQTDGAFGDGDADHAALVQPTTGVPRGSLGTGTAHHDTQEYDVDELRAAASGAAAPGEARDVDPAPPMIAPSMAPAAREADTRSAARGASAPVQPAAGMHPATPTRSSVPIHPVTTRPLAPTTTRSAGPTPSRVVGLAAAALLLVIVGAAALTTGFGTNLGVGQVPVDPGVTAAPTAQPPADAGGNDGGGGNGKGNGNNGGGNGNGKGNGKDKPH
jgi:hypothetical protein